MHISCDTDVDRPVEDVWSSLTDVDSVLAALPGAALARDGATASGSLKCKLGSTQITYRLTARAEVGAAEFHTAVLTLAGTEARGTGTIAASLTVAVRSGTTTTQVEVSGEIDATGRAENATEAAWQKVVQGMVNALLPPPAPPAPAPPPRPPLAIAPQPAQLPAARSATSQRPLAFGLVAVALLLLIRRLRRRRTAK